VTAIINALVALDQSLNGLESAAFEQQRKTVKAQQQDLFNGASTHANGNSIDRAMLAGKVDMAINKLEQMLREG